jgi:glutamate synthase domain-containing protein 2/glutamate synthase domain-containing protein 3/glutamate synthase domain-containing protein 1
MIMAVPKRDQDEAASDHSACGVGFVASETGQASNQILEMGLRALEALEHRGGVAADFDAKTGFGTSDGAGVTVALDQAFWEKKYAILNDTGALGDRDLAVATFYIPRGDNDKQDRCVEIIREELRRLGYYKDARRRSSQRTEYDTLGKKARDTHPTMVQYLIPEKPGVDKATFDRDLYLMKRRIQSRVAEEKLAGQGANRFYIPSMSRHHVVYKSLSLAHKLTALYDDLNPSKGYKTPYVIFHRRFSTNTAPAWERSHPYASGLAHNGEINSLATNIEVFKRLERIMLNLYGAHASKDLLDVIQAGGTDSAMLDNALEFLMHAGFSPPAVKSLLVPEAVMPDAEMSDDVRRMYEYIDALIGPWDGPNTMVMPGNGMVQIGGDRNGLRPVRYVRTKQGIIYAGSEDGMVQAIDNKDVIERGNLLPGEMLAVSLVEGRIIRDQELKAMAAREIEEKLGIKALLANVKDMPVAQPKPEDYEFLNDEEELRTHQRLGFFSQELIEFLDETAEKGKEPLGSMGDDTPLAVASPILRSLPNLFQQKFAQVTNPPIDSIREKAVMSLKTHIGSFYDAEGRKTKRKINRLRSPILLNAEFEKLQASLGKQNIDEIDCTFDIDGDENQMRVVLDQIKERAAVAAKYGKHIVFTDKNVGGDRVAIPMELVVGAVNTHLSNLGIRSQTSLNVRSGEAYGSHDFATLIGLAGADTVNAYMAEETIASRHKQGVYKFSDGLSAFGRETPLGEFITLYQATGFDELDADHARKVAEVKDDPALSAFLETHKNATLEMLAGHPDEAVRNAFMGIAARLKVDVHKTFENTSLKKVLKNWQTSSENGLLKVMAKMGIAHVSSYRGGRLFESLGVSKEVIAECFPGVPSPVGGLSLQQLQQRAVQHHREVHAKNPAAPLEHVGRYKFRSGKGTEPHILTAPLIKKFQASVKAADFESGYKIYREYVAELKDRSEEYRFQPRDWMGIKNTGKAIPLDQVESRRDIIARFFTGGMSDGSLTPEAHETLAIAANRLGFKSNSGEGGEHPERYGTEKRSKIKQMASGRFGVDLDYILDADIIQIKIAQGAKPGEGGELPGNKVKARVAFLRHCKEGTTLISPAPQHDIYSIEDLEQLIYDIKQVRPDIKVDVKLVASSGVDTIAAGVAKCGADSIHVGGFNGGSGASPQLSFPHAGMPWETFMNQIHRKLVEEGFRGRVKLSADGGMRMGRDIVIAALMGAEEYGYGLQALIAEGCELVRSCQNGDCPFHIAGGEGVFMGTPEMVMNMMEFIAEDVREILAELGFKSIDEALGRTDLLEQVWGQDLGLTLDEILPGLKDLKPEQIKETRCQLAEGKRNDRIDPKNPNKVQLGDQILTGHKDEIIGKIVSGSRFEASYDICNEDRTFGARISGTLRKTIIDQKGRATRLKEDQIKLNLKGCAGQSFGAFLMQGMTLDLEGAANDGVGKSLSGGKIVIRPDSLSEIYNNTQNNVILGNAVLYGASSGELYAAGRAGNRFGIRLSGATAVVEGTGTNACNYMTAGTAVILGDVGHSFGSGMSGGEAFVYDENDTFKKKAHGDVKGKVAAVQDEATKDRLKGLVTKHFNETGSQHAKKILNDWDNAVQKFKTISFEDPAAQNAPAHMVPLTVGGLSAPAEPRI